MGIDGNPQLHPYANLEKMGEPCTTSLDCGDKNGNACTDPGTGVRQCGAKTLSELACPSGTMYRNLSLSWTIVAGACFVEPDAGVEIYGVMSGSAEASAILELVNTATVETLDDDVALDSRAAKNIVAYRAGNDGLEGTTDDTYFATLEELDTISYVSERAFGKLLAFVQ